MKRLTKSRKKLIALVLLFVIVLTVSFVLSGCEILNENCYALPEGYTGGFANEFENFGSPEMEYYWVETYDECLSAIEKLESHGSKIDKSLIFSYEGELFDTKYCFSFDRDKSDKIAFGEDPFDRYTEKVSVKAWAFFKDVNIDELIYSDVKNYDGCSFSGNADGYVNALSENPNLKEKDFEIAISLLDDPIDKIEWVYCTAKYDDALLCSMDFLPMINESAAADAFRAMVGSLTIVGN